MRRGRNRIRISISPAACVMFALMVLVLPLRWLVASIVAAAFHEFCHAVAVHLCGSRIRSVRIGDRGAVMESEDVPGWKILICILAGPLGSLVLLLFARFIPRIALCGLVQGIYNLLPIFPLDGGNAVRCIRDMKNRP